MSTKVEYTREYYQKIVSELQAENKALKETLEIFQIESELKIKALKESRDELLDILKEVEKVPTYEIDFESIMGVIQKAEALKEKTK